LVIIQSSEPIFEAADCIEHASPHEYVCAAGPSATERPQDESGVGRIEPLLGQSACQDRAIRL
jgi:hypothetical protein